jgi:hypothetical protein
MGELRYSYIILALGNRWRLVIDITGLLFYLTGLLFYLRGKILRYPLDKRLGGPQSRSRRSGEEGNVVMPRTELGPSL